MVRRESGLGYLLALALVLSLVACESSAPRQPVNEASLPGKDACFWTRTVDDWTVLDDSTLIVNAPGPNNYYLVRLFAPVPELRFQLRLGFESKGGEMDRFCRDNGYVISRDSMRVREPVVAVRAIGAVEAKQMMSGAVSQRSLTPGPSPASGRGEVAH